MDFQQIKELVDESILLLTYGHMGQEEALDRATRFLIVAAHLTEFKRLQDIEFGKLQTLKEAVFAVALDKTTGKNITEKKALAALNADFVAISDKAVEADAAISWARTNIRIFENAHITYRMMAKGD